MHVDAETIDAPRKTFYKTSFEFGTYLLHKHVPSHGPTVRAHRPTVPHHWPAHTTTQDGCVPLPRCLPNTLKFKNKRPYPLPQIKTGGLGETVTKNCGVL